MIMNIMILQEFMTLQLLIERILKRNKAHQRHHNDHHYLDSAWSLLYMLLLFLFCFLFFFLLLPLFFCWALQIEITKIICYSFVFCFVWGLLFFFKFPQFCPLIMLLATIGIIPTHLWFLGHWIATIWTCSRTYSIIFSLILFLLLEVERVRWKWFC